MKILILAGGKGSRLWPLIHPPKQFFLRSDGVTLFQKTLLRFLQAYRAMDICVVTEKKHKTIALNQMKEIGVNVSLLLEEEGKNTAPALLQALTYFEDELFFIAPCDHLIQPETVLLETIEMAKKVAENSKTVLFGIRPSFPSSDFGYIQYDPSYDPSPVIRFVEKPSFEKAKGWIEQGDFLWNSGMLLLHRPSFIHQIETHFPDYLKGHCPCISIDKAFLEGMQDLIVFPLSISWVDLGSWEGIYHVSQKDQNGNVVYGAAKISDVSQSLIISNDKNLHVKEMNNAVIVSSEEGILVTHLKNQDTEQIPQHEALHSVST